MGKKGEPEEQASGGREGAFMEELSLSSSCGTGSRQGKRWDHKTRLRGMGVKERGGSL